MKEGYYNKTNGIYSDISKNPTIKVSKLVDYGNWWGSYWKILGDKYMLYGMIMHGEGVRNLSFRKRGLIHWLLSGTELKRSDFKKETAIKLFGLIDTLYNEWCENDKDRIKNSHRNEVLSNIKMESGRNHETIMVFDKFLDKVGKWQEQKDD